MYRFLLFILFLSPLGLISQNKGLDVIQLNDGSTIAGTILLVNTDSIYFQNKLTGQIAIRRDQVNFIDLAGELASVTEYSPSDYQLSMESSLLINDERIGPSIQCIFSRRVYKGVFIGLGTGVNFYDFDQNEYSYPLFLSTKMYLHEGLLSPFFQLNGGYGFGQADEDIGITNVEGGWLFNPRMGVEFGSDYFRANIFLGLKFQKLTYDYLVWNGEITETKRHRRIEIGASFIF